MWRPTLVVVSPLVFLAVSLSSAETCWSASSFRDEQMKSRRVQAAQNAKGAIVRQLFAEKGLTFPPSAIYLRAFKKERILELWAKRKNNNRFELVKEYLICASSGNLGPKRRQGDAQVPEGFYFINHFQPESQYHLSLGINYPNDSDRILGTKARLGGQIYIHGNCVTIGCIPLENAPVEEVYLAAMEARNAGQLKIPVHIFPARLNNLAFKRLIKENLENKPLVNFWENLKQGYDAFEKEHRIPKFFVDKNGKYIFPK